MERKEYMNVNVLNEIPLLFMYVLLVGGCLAEAVDREASIERDSNKT